MKEDSNKTWLMMIHQIPPKPDYFRVKIWRRLQQIGAVAIKPSVYVLPNSESAYEDFSWILKEIDQGGGDEQVVVDKITGALVAGAVGDTPAHDLAGAIQDVILAIFYLGPEGGLEVRADAVRPYGGGGGEVFFVATGFDEGDEVPAEG